MGDTGIIHIIIRQNITKVLPTQLPKSTTEIFHHVANVAPVCKLFVRLGPRTER